MATFQLPMVKESISWAAATAVAAAALATDGFKDYRGSEPLRQGPLVWGRPSPFDEPAASVEPFVASIGKVDEVLNGYLKPYACCRYIHPAADALIDILRTRAIPASEVSEVVVRLHEAALELCDPQPQSLEHAQYSFPFVLASILVHGDAGAAEICEDHLHDDAVLLMAQRVRMEHAPELDRHHPQHYPAEVVVVTTGGERITERRLVIRGEIDKPMSEQDLYAKFGKNVGPVIGDEKSAQLWDLCLGLENRAVSDVFPYIDAAVAT